VVANLISVLRMVMAAVLCVLVAQQGQPMYVPAFWLTLLIIWMDGWDGFVARLLNECSPAGAVIDILCDRVVEQAYWITFACLGWVPLWMVLAIISRGVVVDGLRSLALQAGYTAFGSNTMMQHPLGVLLVSSRFSRWTYSVLKAIAFALLFLVHTPDGQAWQFLADACVLGTLVFCVLRGLPVLLEARRFI
jgi:CDP-diacylglycerol---glycerol-3-phosphate 3-phosphatidyltransferase